MMSYNINTPNGGPIFPPALLNFLQWVLEAHVAKIAIFFKMSANFSARPMRPMKEWCKCPFHLKIVAFLFVT